MARPPQTEIVLVSTDQEWMSYHAIRRQVLFEARGRGEAYNENHPDDRHEGNYPLLLLVDGRPVGTARLDVHPEALGIVRLVAILPDYHRQGFGSALMAGLEKHAMLKGITRLQVSSAPDAVGFYQRLGWSIVDAAQESPFLAKKLESARSGVRHRRD
jgi:GNAT superfamily N-acetyltransferase